MTDESNLPSELKSLPAASWVHSRWRRSVIKIVVLLSILIIWQGLVKRPTGDARGTSLHAESGAMAPTGDTLRVATFNIAGGVSPTDDRLDLQRTAKYLKGFDLIGLEEVHGGSIVDWRDQAEILGDTLHMPWLFCPSERRWWHDYFGNGVLCDLPVTGWRRFPISTTMSSSNRSLLEVVARWHDQSLVVLITHLDRHEDHDVELGAAIAAFDNAPKPVILLGDLNTDTFDPQLAALRRDPAVTDALTVSLGSGVPPINNDWIFARGLRCVTGGLTDNDASDHKLAWAELTDH